MKTLNISTKKSKLAILVCLLILLSTSLISPMLTAATTGVDRLLVDYDLCQGCGFCEAVAPDCFMVENDKAVVLLGWIYHPIQFVEAYEGCPYGAIYFDNY